MLRAERRPLNWHITKNIGGTLLIITVLAAGAYSYKSSEASRHSLQEMAATHNLLKAEVKDIYANFDAPSPDSTEEKKRQLDKVLTSLSKIDQQIVSTSNQIYKSHWFLFSALILSLSTFFAVLIFISRRIKKAFKELMNAFEQSNSGDENVLLDISSDDEFGKLAEAFNHMSQNLQTRNNSIRSYIRQLKAKEKEEKIIFHKLVDGILILDNRGNILRCNPIFSKMFGHNFLTQNLVGKKCFDALGEELTNLLIETRESPSRTKTKEILLSEGRIGQAVCSYLRPSKEKENHHSSAFVIVVRDITKEKELVNVKDGFIATVSHELRTPLASILGFASLINKRLNEKILPGLPPGEKKIVRWTKQTKDNISVVLEESVRLSRLINNVLDIAKMESGKTEWNMEFVDAEQLISQAITATSSLFENNPVEISWDVEKDLPPIFGDKDKLIQVIINLISNAEKFTEEGSILVKACRLGNEIHISVKDTGIGISKENQKKVFEKFQQVGCVLTNKPKGSGLGLYITQQILENHQGRIWLTSELEKGSCFTFSVPTKIVKTTVNHP